MMDKRRVLVVDDEEHMRGIVAFDLEEAGYHVEQAESGQAAMQRLKDSTYDLVVSDVRMPHGNGLELLRWIKSADPLLPGFIFMTAFSDLSAEEALAQGAEAFLTKPLDHASLLEAVAEGAIHRINRWTTPPERAEGLRCLSFDETPLTSSRPPRTRLGGGGMFIEMDNDFPSSHEIVGLNLDHEGLKIEGHGRVRWVRHEPSPGRSAGIGVEFVHLAPESRSRFLAHLRSKAPVAYVPHKIS